MAAKNSWRSSGSEFHVVVGQDFCSPDTRAVKLHHIQRQSQIQLKTKRIGKLNTILYSDLKCGRMQNWMW